MVEVSAPYIPAPLFPVAKPATAKPDAAAEFPVMPPLPMIAKPALFCVTFRMLVVLLPVKLAVWPEIEPVALMLPVSLRLPVIF